jgi:hypothetical protein
LHEVINFGILPFHSHSLFDLRTAPYERMANKAKLIQAGAAQLLSELLAYEALAKCLSSPNDSIGD